MLKTVPYFGTIYILAMFWKKYGKHDEKTAFPDVFLDPNASRASRASTLANLHLSGLLLFCAIVGESQTLGIVPKVSTKGLINKGGRFAPPFCRPFFFDFWYNSKSLRFAQTEQPRVFALWGPLLGHCLHSIIRHIFTFFWRPRGPFVFIAAFFKG